MPHVPIDGAVRSGEERVRVLSGGRVLVRARDRRHPLLLIRICGALLLEELGEGDEITAVLLGRRRVFELSASYLVSW